MDTVAIHLVSLGDIAAWIDQSVTAMLTRVITPLVANVTARVLPLVSAGLSISLLWYGWLIASGAIQTPVLAALRRCATIVVVVSIAGSGGLYQTQIANAMIELPTSVTQLFTDSVKTPAEVLDNAANNGAEIGTRLQDRAPHGLTDAARSFLFILVSLTVTVLSTIMSALGMVVLISVKTGMGLVVILGPVCILAILFEKTQQFFLSWLRQGLYYAVYAGLFMLVFIFIMGMFGNLQSALLKLTTANEINIFSMLTAIVLFMSCSIFMFQQVSSVATQITGGRGGGIGVPYLGRIG